MKKLMASVFAAVALTALASTEKVAVVRIADASDTVAAVNKLCTMIGNPMLAGMAVPGIASLEPYRFFGTPRKGGAITFVAFADLDNNGGVEGAALCPIESKEAFLARFKNVSQKDGMTFIDDDSFGMFACSYVDFSADGKWVATSDKPQFVKLALACIADAKPLDGYLVRASANGKAAAKLLEFVQESAAYKGAAFSAESMKQMADMKSIRVDIGIDDAGIVIRTLQSMVEGSESDKTLSKAKTLGAAPFAFAGANALGESAFAENAGGRVSHDMTKVMLDIAASKGLKLDFLNALLTESSYTSEIDIPALSKYMKEDGQAAISKINPEQVGQEWQTAMLNGVRNGAEGPAFNSKFAVRGFTPKYSVAQRYAKTLPEAAGKPVSTASVFALYPTLKAVATQVAACEPEAQSFFQPILAAIPDEGVGGIAGASWRQGSDFHSIFRISADELRGIGTAGFVVMGAIQSQCSQPAAGAQPAGAGRGRRR